VPRYSTDPEHLLRICQIRFVRGSGPGGQHRNKTESGVQLIHPPTGIVVSATERRSQSQNKGVALERLIDKLKALNHRPKRRRPTRPTRSSQRKRLEAKTRRGETKAGRRKPGGDD
jgi:protein subunit release factor B